jgi:DNA-directed RNA polymerase specialized sigma24 family protein
VERDQAMAELPVAYATALRLQAAGAEQSLIADALGIDIFGVGPLLALAEAKLGQLLDCEPPQLLRQESTTADGHHG